MTSRFIKKTLPEPPRLMYFNTSLPEFHKGELVCAQSLMCQDLENYLENGYPNLPDCYNPISPCEKFHKENNCVHITHGPWRRDLSRPHSRNLPGWVYFYTSCRSSILRISVCTITYGPCNALSITWVQETPRVDSIHPVIGSPQGELISNQVFLERMAQTREYAS